MSGTAGVANTFQNAVTATGAQLDANYTTIVAYLNDPTNRNNYSGDGAATNTVVLTFSPPVAGGYTAGLDLCWKWGVTNSGGVVLNANGLGNISVVNPDGSALVSGQGKAGSIGRAVYDGTRAVYIAAPAVWTQAINTTVTATINAPVNISGAAGGQIIFPATQNASSGVNTLDDYEEGSWTPVDSSGASLVFTGVTGTYVKIGIMVFASFALTFPATADGTQILIGGLPFQEASSASEMGGFINFTDQGTFHTLSIVNNTTTFRLVVLSGANNTNNAFSGKTLRGTLVYKATA